MGDQRNMLSRVRLMAEGNPAWDLSDNDIEALKYVLGEAAKYRESTAERDQLRAEVERLRGKSERYLAARDTAEQERQSLVSKHALRVMELKQATARAEAAEALLRDLAAIINPHEAYDATKITGWARDTVERAAVADRIEATNGR